MLVSSEWHYFIDKLSIDPKIRICVSDSLNEVLPDPFHTGDDNDGEKFIKTLALMATDDVDWDFREIAKVLKHSINSKAARDAFTQVMLTLRERLTVREGMNIEYLMNLIQFADWRTGPSRSSPARIFTLNYDNSIERAAEAQGYSCLSLPGQTLVTSKLGTDIQIPTISLLKINGSVDWRFHKQEIGSRTVNILTKRDEQWTPTPESTCFLDLNCTPWARKLAKVQLSTFEKQLLDSSFLCTIGYSFRRKDINQVLMRWVESDRANALTIVDVNPSRYHKQFVESCKGFSRVYLQEMTASKYIEENLL